MDSGPEMTTRVEVDRGSTSKWSASWLSWDGDRLPKSCSMAVATSAVPVETRQEPWPQWKRPTNVVLRPSFRQLVGPTVNAKMDLIRRHGNNAVHRAAAVPKTVAEASVKELFHSLYWFARTYTRQASALPPAGLEFDTSAVPRPLSPQARALKQAELKAKEAEDEARFKEQAEQLAAERAQNADLARQLEEFKAQIAAAKAANQSVRDTHDYDEQATGMPSSTCSSKKRAGTSSPEVRTPSTR